MSAKEIVLKFYKSEALIDSEILKDFLHPEILIDWNSTKGFVQMNYDSLMDLSNELSRAYVTIQSKNKSYYSGKRHSFGAVFSFCKNN